MKGLIVDQRTLVLAPSLPEPKPKPGRVLVRVRATTLNPSDVDIAAGSWDALLNESARAAQVRTGLEFAGVVVEGGEVLIPGQDVYGYPDISSAQKTHQEYLAIDEDCVGPMPAGLSFNEAASLPLSGQTVLTALRDVAAIQPDERLLVIGAAGGVGLINVQVAKRVYRAAVTAVAGPGVGDFLVAMGADQVIDYRQTHIAEISGHFDVIMDWTTNYSFADIAHLLAEDGRFVPADPYKNSEDFVEGSEAASKTKFLMAAKATQADLATVSEWVAAGHLKPAVDSVFPFSRFEQALERLEMRSKRGRVVLHLEE